MTTEKQLYKQALSVIEAILLDDTGKVRPGERLKAAEELRKRKWMKNEFARQKAAQQLAELEQTGEDGEVWAITEKPDTRAVEELSAEDLARQQEKLTTRLAEIEGRLNNADNE